MSSATTEITTQTKPAILLKAINGATPEQIDTLWSILKYKEIGIYRKVKCMSSVLGLNFEKVVSDLPKDESGRILDYKTRHLIHDTLIENS
tara:strand:+ start:277 stop:549 length:273 start_codon:yes stop_codon:yes gene_type:complete